VRVALGACEVDGALHATDLATALRRDEVTLAKAKKALTTAGYEIVGAIDKRALRTSFGGVSPLASWEGLREHDDDLDALVGQTLIDARARVTAERRAERAEMLAIHGALSSLRDSERAEYAFLVSPLNPLPLAVRHSRLKALLGGLTTKRKSRRQLHDLAASQILGAAAVGGEWNPRLLDGVAVADDEQLLTQCDMADRASVALALGYAVV
jgi:hypothetical protein